jgi:hypothetical protein
MEVFSNNRLKWKYLPKELICGVYVLILSKERLYIFLFIVHTVVLGNVLCSRSVATQSGISQKRRKEFVRSLPVKRFFTTYTVPSSDSVITL